MGGGGWLTTDEMFIAGCSVLGEDGLPALSRKEEFEAQEAGLQRKNTSMEIESPSSSPGPTGPSPSVCALLRERPRHSVLPFPRPQDEAHHPNPAQLSAQT